MQKYVLEIGKTLKLNLGDFSKFESSRCRFDGFSTKHSVENFPKTFSEPGGIRTSHCQSEQNDDDVFYGNTITPLVHVAIYHGIVHGVGHGQPVDAEIDVLDNDNKR